MHLVKAPARDGGVQATCMMAVAGLNVAAVCAGVVSVMWTLGCRAIWAMAERVGLR